MTDPTLATKSPENDALEEVLPDPDTLDADSSAPPTPPPKMGDCCVTDRPTPGGQSSTGEIINIDGTDTYISKPADYPHTPARFLLLLTSGTGIASTNNQIQADKFASKGYVVVMPDLFDKDAAPNSKELQNELGQVDDNSSFFDKFKFHAVSTAKAFMIDMWLARHTEVTVMPVLHKVLEKTTEMFKDAVNLGGGVYSVGYCFGGRYILLLSKETQDLGEGKTKKGPAIKAGVLAHPTSVISADFHGLKAPVSMICVENDDLFPDSIRKFGEDQMAKDELEHEVTVYPGVPHGFSVVGEYPESSIKDAQAAAYDQILNWLQNH